VKPTIELCIVIGVIQSHATIMWSFSLFCTILFWEIVGFWLWKH